MNNYMKVGVGLVLAGLIGYGLVGHQAQAGDCGEGSSGTLVNGACVYPPSLVDLVNGQSAGDTGARQVFHVDNYSGTNNQKIASASLAANAVGGAVVFDHVYDISSTVTMYSNVLYTGGGLRRADNLSSDFALVQSSPSYATGIVVDQMLFDGNNTHNSWTHDWTKNNTGFLRGANTIRNSVFYDTPSENLTICGATVTGNIAFNLSGSFLHISCSVDHLMQEWIYNNYVEHSNLVGNAVMGHTEGTITYSANSKDIHSSGNVFRYGNEGVFGIADADDGPMDSVGDYFSHYPRLMSFNIDGDPSLFSFSDIMEDVAFNNPVVTALGIQVMQGSPAKHIKIATVSDVETKKQTIAASWVSNTSGLTVTNVANDGLGNVFADIAATCSASSGSVTIKAEDVTHQSSNACLATTVTNNTAPKLGSYAAQTFLAGQTRVVTPTLSPSDNGSISSIGVSVSAGFTGAIMIDATTGQVGLAGDTGPVGHYVVTVAAIDNCGASTVKTFGLTVN